MFIKPNWSAPLNVKALCTTRQAKEVAEAFKGQSLPPFDKLNLATYVGDDIEAVNKNRQLLQKSAALPTLPFWLDQQHTVNAVCLDALSYQHWTPVIADASWTTQPDKVAVAMTADCMPLLITNTKGTLVCAIHAGWKGLADGIVTQTVQSLPESPQNLLVWIGPCIRQANFQVGLDVYQRFCAKNPENAQYFQKQMQKQAQKTQTQTKYLADLPGLVKCELLHLGITQILDSELCTYDHSEQFYSYRRDGVTGRMASLIWIENEF